MKAETTCCVGCMDFRLMDVNGYRNAGGTVGGIDFTDQSISAVRITVHRDCGGLKATAAVLDGKDLGLTAEAARLFEDRFVKYFRNNGFEGAARPEGSYDPEKMARMEEFNRALQERLARQALAAAGRSDVTVTADLVDVPRGLHADLVVVLIGSSPKTDAQVLGEAGTKPGEAYLVRGSSLADVLASVELAAKVMGKERFVVMNGNQQLLGTAQAFAKNTLPVIAGSEASISLVSSGKARIR